MISQFNWLKHFQVISIAEEPSTQFGGVQNRSLD